MTLPEPNAIPEEQVLRLVVEGTVSETGTEFFRALVRNLATAMGTTGAWVSEYLPEANRLRGRAFWFNGAFVENYEHDAPNTPCEAVLTERKLVFYPDRIVEIYPPWRTSALSAVSCMGVPLFDLAGEIMGHLAVLDTKPLPAEPRLISLFEIFAARAAAGAVVSRPRTRCGPARRNSPHCWKAPWMRWWSSMQRRHPTGESGGGKTVRLRIRDARQNLRRFLPPLSAAGWTPA
jgi:hypothetical protein